MKYITTASTTPTIARRSRHRNSEDARVAAMARLVGVDGDLRRYVQKSPRWCRSIGDSVTRMLRSGQPVHSLDVERLTYVLDAGIAAERAVLVARKPKPGEALFFKRVSYTSGISRWVLSSVPLSVAQREHAVGAA